MGGGGLAGNRKKNVDFLFAAQGKATKNLATGYYQWLLSVATCIAAVPWISESMARGEDDHHSFSQPLERSR
jgi:hypothetical protein